MFKDNSKQDCCGPDAGDGLHCEIIDIRHDTGTESLSRTLRTSLKGGLSGDDEPSFPDRLLWDQQGLRLFEKITFSKDYYVTNSEIEIMEANCRDIARKIAPNSLVVEMGSG